MGEDRELQEVRVEQTPPIQIPDQAPNQITGGGCRHLMNPDNQQLKHPNLAKPTRR
jgi:hypothetical protein